MASHRLGKRQMRLSSIITAFEAEFPAQYQGQILPSHRMALAKVFRAKLLEAITQVRLDLPNGYPEDWVVDC
jgi:hypothetical protein